MKPFHSPYYKESHFRLQKEMRVFVDSEVKQDAERSEADGKRPSVAVSYTHLTLPTICSV